MNVFEKRIGRARKGFSLLELTLVLVILGILGTVVVIAVGPRIQRARITTTETTLRTVHNELMSYHAEFTVYPPTLAELPLQSLPVDGWDRDLYYRVTPGAQRPFMLLSFGEDGVADTEDDIDAWDVIERRRR
jgi:general secretion pathway protein G